MEHQANTEAGHRKSAAAFGRWFAFLGGAVAWTAHLMLSYAIGEFGCVAELHHTQWAGVTLTGWLLIALTAATLAVAGAATWTGYREYMRYRHAHEQPLGPADYADRADDEHADPCGGAGSFLLRSGFLMSGFFAVIIVGEAFPLVLYLQRC